MAFEGSRCIARGGILEVVRDVKQHIEKHPDASMLLFDDEDARIVEVDFRGSAEQVLARLEAQLSRGEAQLSRGDADVSGEGGKAHAFHFGKVHETATVPAGDSEKKRRGPGRPKLGVVSREVTLLPRHWEWLSTQPGGASVTLRKLVETARKANSGKDRIRRAQEITYRFMNAVGGDLPGYEEALRALYAPDAARFASLVADWPKDVREHVLRFAREAFEEQR
ncbi:MAG: DUF2239 family protein [Bacteroidota bacterium]|nr:DUF2239 family protein [Bacteroidota bacterium]